MRYRLILLPLFAFACIGQAQTISQIQETSKPQGTGVQKAYVTIQSPKLSIGDQAPALDTAKWIKGTPVSFGGGHVTVVNFWATWSAPAHQAFPVVADLAQKFKGKVDFVGVSVQETKEDVESGVYVRNVDAFVHMQGARLPYSIAVDDAQGTLNRKWLENSNQPVPCAFVVDQSGRIAWIGHPLADLCDVLPKVVAGTYDTSRAAAERHIQIRVEGQLHDLIVPVQAALTAGNEKDAVVAIDRAISQNPELVTALGPTRFQMLLRYDEPAAYAYAKQLSEGPCKNSPNVLNLLAWSIIEEDSGVKNPDLPTALNIAKRANELTNNSDPYILDTYALALFRTGDKPKALELQERAVTLSENKKGLDPKIVSEMKERLARYKKAINP